MRLWRHTALMGTFSSLSPEELQSIVPFPFVLSQRPFAFRSVFWEHPHFLIGHFLS